MDPKHLFFDSRHYVGCAYCGNGGEFTGDHVPSKVLLDAPLPTENVRKVPICADCDAGLSKDELYVACLIECARLGTTDPEAHSRESIRRNLQKSPALRARLNAARMDTLFGDVEWQPETERVTRVALKLARGHIYLDLTEPKTVPPGELGIRPLATLTPEQITDFETPRAQRLWPEIGSPAFVRATKEMGVGGPLSEWVEVQPNRYRYWVGADPVEVRVVLGDYLAIWAIWD